MKAALQVTVLGALALVMPLPARAVNTIPAPVPTLEEIFPRVMERSQRERENDRAFESRFIFVKSKLTDTRNGSGDLKKHELKITTNNPALKKLATPSAASPEKSSPGSESRANARGRAYEKDEFVVNEDLIKRFTFTLVGRELLNGRPTLVVDFTPAKRDLPEKGLKDKFINRTAGRVWLDEEDMAMAKVTLHLTERVNVIGGLVGSVWKLNFGFERTRTEDGLWYAHDVTWHLEGRELFSGRIMDYHEKRTDVRPAE